MIAGGGFAVMAWRLAQRRSGAHPSVRYLGTPRHYIEASGPGCFPAHREYYRILDHAEFWAAHARGGQSSLTRRCAL